MQRRAGHDLTLLAICPIVRAEHFSSTDKVPILMAELDEAQTLIYAYLDEALQQFNLGSTSDSGHLTTIAYYYRLRGIEAYLRRMDESAFVSDLSKAAQARLHYLRACVAGHVRDGDYTTALKNFAYFDALAAHDWTSATELAQSCAGQWNQETQYEEDFLWVEFLQAALAAPESEARLLDRFREVAQADNPFLACCTALHTRAAEALPAALNTIADIRQANFAAKRDPPDLPVLVLATEPYIDVQALAVCRLAQRRGMPAPVGIRSVPDTLLEMPEGLHRLPAPDSWRIF